MVTAVRSRYSAYQFETDGYRAAITVKNIATMTEYPKPTIPTDPILSGATFGVDSGCGVRSVCDAGQVRYVTSGRVAIALALREMRITTGDQVLVPAYHSKSMIEPVIWFGAEPVFYRVGMDTAIDLVDIAARITPRTRVLMVTNYFGFPQDLAVIRAFCDTQGIRMLEDCAHGFFGEHAGQALGSFGDYAIASSMKFFPVYDGGCLISSRHDLGALRLVSAGLKFELKTAINTLEKGFEYRRMSPLRWLLSIPMGLKNLGWGLLKRGKVIDARAIGPDSSHGAFGFEEKWLDKRASLMSRLIMRTASRTRIANARRANYLRLQASLGGLPGCRALYPDLPAGVVPWVFPLLTDVPAGVFPALRNAGVPVVRFAEFLWDGVDATVCANSVALSRRVLQFPCHQELRQPEIDWMVATARRLFLAAAETEVRATV